MVDEHENDFVEARAHRRDAARASAIERVGRELGTCIKCERKATRAAVFGSHKGPIEADACDVHGGETVREHPDAAAARAWNATNEAWLKAAGLA